MLYGGHETNSALNASMLNGSCTPGECLVIGLRQLAPLDHNVHGVAPAKRVWLRAAARAGAYCHLPPGLALGDLHRGAQLTLAPPLLHQLSPAAIVNSHMHHILRCSMQGM